MLLLPIHIFSAQKQPDIILVIFVIFWYNICDLSTISTLFEAGILITRQSLIHLQICCGLIHYSTFMFKDITVTDNPCQGDLPACMGY